MEGRLHCTALNHSKLVRKTEFRKEKEKIIIIMLLIWSGTVIGGLYENIVELRILEENKETYIIKYEITGY